MTRRFWNIFFDALQNLRPIFPTKKRDVRGARGVDDQNLSGEGQTTELTLEESASPSSTLLFSLTLKIRMQLCSNTPVLPHNLVICP